MAQRKDHNIITDIVTKNSRVLDIGCADGTLLKILKKKKIFLGKALKLIIQKLKIV